MLTSFSAVLDFVRIVGTVLLIEKLCRRNKGLLSGETNFQICIALVCTAFLTEVYLSKIEKSESTLNLVS